MAGKRRRRQNSRQLDVDDLVALVGALNTIRNGGGHSGPPQAGVTPLTDPSVNVKERVELQAAFDKERRESDKEWQKRLDAERDRADVATREAEKGRIDSKFADVVSNALLVQQTTATAASSLATAMANATETLRKQQETTDLATRAAIRAVEQNQATGGGMAAQQREQRGDTQFESAQRARTSQWIVGLSITAGLTVFGLVVSIGIFVATHVRFTG